MGGEESYYELVNKVVQALLRQYYLAGHGKFMFDFSKCRHLDNGEIVTVLYRLQKDKVIKIEHTPDPIETYALGDYLVTTTKEKLEQYAKQIRPHINQHEETTEFYLNLIDNKLIVSFGPNDVPVRRFQDDTDGINLFQYLFNKRLDQVVSLAEIKSSSTISSPNSLNVLIGNLKLKDILEPFLKTLSKTSIKLSNVCVLDGVEAEAYISKLEILKNKKI